jgi:hypothetical protein
MKRKRGRKMSEWINYAAEVCKTKDGKGRYIRIIKPFSALRGNNLRMVKFEDHLDEMVAKGFMTTDERDDKLEKVTWVKYVIHVPPQEQKEEDNYKSKTGWINDAVELRKSKAGSFYLFVAHDFEAQADSAIKLKKYSDKIKELHANGFIDDDKLQKREEVAAWLHFVGSIPPKK